jgi:membrane protein DedA with SNARE-associated domain
VLESIVTWLTDTILRLGYPGIVVLMAIESSFLPLPSEVVMPPAGYLVAQGRMNFALVVLSGLVGSVIGALVNYGIAVALGRPVLHRYHRYFLVREAALDRAEEFFRRHGEISTFVGRLLPVVRHLISIPAGIARMSLKRFVAYTALGAGIWCLVLTVVGWYVGRHAAVVTDLDAVIRDPTVHRYVSRAGLAVLPVAALVLAVYVWRARRRGRAASSDAST